MCKVAKDKYNLLILALTQKMIFAACSIYLNEKR